VVLDNIHEKKYADTLSVTMFVSSVIVIGVWETDLPVWGFLLTLLVCASCLILCFLPEFHICCVLAFVYALPLSVIRATISQQLGLNVFIELIIGYTLPDHPLAMMFKTCSYSGLENHCNVWQFWTGCDLALDSMGIALSIGGIG
jgi:hypothetical protein